MSAGDVERLIDALDKGFAERWGTDPISGEDRSAVSEIITPWLRAHDAEVAARARREALLEAASDQESMLLDAMDGEFLLVDCGHAGHEDGLVPISHARPTDITRWARDWLRDRADREEGK